VQRFARRRPGTFLAAAAIAGFAVGRVLRGASGGEDGSSGGSSDTGPGWSADAVASRAEPSAGAPPPAEMPLVTAPASGFHPPEPVTPPGPLGTGEGR
jgi:hypothetical protein